jgi:hypothetical protein
MMMMKVLITKLREGEGEKFFTLHYEHWSSNISQVGREIFIW